MAPPPTPGPQQRLLSTVQSTAGLWDYVILKPETWELGPRQGPQGNEDKEGSFDTRWEGLGSPSWSDL